MSLPLFLLRKREVKTSLYSDCRIVPKGKLKAEKVKIISITVETKINIHTKCYYLQELLQGAKHQMVVISSDGSSPKKTSPGRA